ncbi:YdcF family protein [Belliella buryatensis]|uniref:YdcF family protein n=1 Tax=Belliella buryatensis TaxID=1500549 RepID=UPI00148363BF|nr:ElyC/SanA/YdcF family protein [Belliella buryatensis]
MENKYEVLDPNGLKNPVLVLGGGHDTLNNLPYNQQLTNGALGRVVEGLRLFRASNSKTLIFSGPSLAEHHPTQAEIQAYMLSEICELSSDAILKLNTPTTTEEEAISYAQALGSISPILVTKAIHMHRAVLTFNSQGIQVIPAPCNFIVKNSKQPWFLWLVPAFSQAPYLGELLKESFGLLFLMIRIKANPKPILSKV